MDKQKLKEALEFAKENGLPSIEVDGVKITVPKEEIKLEVPELKTEEIVKFPNPLDEMSEDEITFYATPYYDELQAKKQKKLEQQTLEEQVRG